MALECCAGGNLKGFEGKVGLVTGAASGIGESIAFISGSYYAIDGGDLAYSFFACSVEELPRDENSSRGSLINQICGGGNPRES